MQAKNLEELCVVVLVISAPSFSATKFKQSFLHIE
jgi:hypothetical protein